MGQPMRSHRTRRWQTSRSSFSLRNRIDSWQKHLSQFSRHLFDMTEDLCKTFDLLTDRQGILVSGRDRWGKLSISGFGWSMDLTTTSPILGHSTDIKTDSLQMIRSAMPILNPRSRMVYAFPWAKSIVYICRHSVKRVYTGGQPGWEAARRYLLFGFLVIFTWQSQEKQTYWRAVIVFH